MPHAAIKLYAGRSDADKQRLADAVAGAIRTTLGGDEASISVSVVDIEPADWMAAVYQPEIAEHPDLLFKRPGYGPLK